MVCWRWQPQIWLNQNQNTNLFTLSLFTEYLRKPINRDPDDYIKFYANVTVEVMEKIDLYYKNDYVYLRYLHFEQK